MLLQTRNCKGFSWLLTMWSTSSMADNLRSLGHLDVDWKQHIDWSSKMAPLVWEVCNSELRLSLRQFFMKGHLVVWSLVRPVATQLGRVYHILRGTIYRRRICYDGQWGGEWGGQPKHDFSWRRGRRYKKIDNNRTQRGDLWGHHFQLRDMWTTPYLCLYLKQSSKRLHNRPGLLINHCWASMQWPVGMCPREFAVTMSIFSRRLCVRSRPSLHIRLLDSAERTHILAADVDCLAFFGWGRGVK